MIPWRKRELHLMVSVKEQKQLLKLQSTEHISALFGYKKLLEQKFVSVVHGIINSVLYTLDLAAYG